MNATKSVKEETLEKKITQLLTEMAAASPTKDSLPLDVVLALLADEEIKAIHDYANTVSITRLGLNDHGPVHLKTVCYNALKMLKMLHAAGVKTNLEKESAGTFADSVTAVILAAMLHDAGMTIARKGHELYSGIITYNIIREILLCALPHNPRRRTISLTLTYKS